MKKFEVTCHEPGSPQRVVAHARWQRSRGRRPAMSYMGITNPDLALEAALFDLSPCCQATIWASLGDGTLIGSCSECGQNVRRINPRTGVEEELDGKSPWTTEALRPVPRHTRRLLRHKVRHPSRHLAQAA